MTVECAFAKVGFVETGGEISACESVLLQVNQWFASKQNVSVADDYPQKEGNHESETNRDRCAKASLLLGRRRCVHGFDPQIRHCYS